MRYIQQEICNRRVPAFRLLLSLCVMLAFINQSEIRVMLSLLLIYYLNVGKYGSIWDNVFVACLWGIFVTDYPSNEYHSKNVFSFLYFFQLGIFLLPFTLSTPVQWLRVIQSPLSFYPIIIVMAIILYVSLWKYTSTSVLAKAAK